MIQYLRYWIGKKKSKHRKRAGDVNGKSCESVCPNQRRLHKGQFLKPTLKGRESSILTHPELKRKEYIQYTERPELSEARRSMRRHMVTNEGFTWRRKKVRFRVLAVRIIRVPDLCDPQLRSMNT